MKRIIVLTAAMLTVVSALAQQPKPAADVTIKTTPASVSLTELSTAVVTDQKAFNDKFQQARAMLDQKQKALQDQMVKLNKQLQDQLKADKHYTSILGQLDGLNKQLQDAGQTAQKQFQTDVGPIQQKVSTENAQIQILIPVVRKENDLPDNSTWDTSTQKWSAPKK